MFTFIIIGVKHDYLAVNIYNFHIALVILISGHHDISVWNYICDKIILREKNVYM